MCSTLITNLKEANLVDAGLTSEICNQRTDGGNEMKYILAWVLGVPGVVIVAWFLIAHMH
jgi:hypothetical protein